MKERTILFSGPMVKAIIDGRKTQTRRIVKPQPIGKQRVVEGLAHVTVGMDPSDDGRVWYVGDCVKPGVEVRCPYGSPGDRLWVKETWRPVWNEELFCAVQYAADSSYRKPDFSDEDRGLRFSDLCEQSGDNAEPWHPSIHMWREMSRLTLEVTGVRVERLQAISEADAIAEGVQTERDHYGGDVPLKVHGSVAWHRYDEKACSAVSAVESYRTLWESINGKGSWDANPWVWAVEFKVAEASK